MAIIELSIVPVGTQTPSVSRYVAKAIQILQGEKDIKYELTSMGTIIEGNLDHLLDLAKKMHRSAFDAGAMRVVTTVKIDERRDQSSSISGKVESVKRQLEQ
jgi:uncharacterized protein (TIGR00106 family)